MRPTRRSVLTGGLLLAVPGVLSACTAEAPPARPQPVDPDVALRAAAVARERQLLARYDALLQQQPDLAPRLSPVRAEHAEHLTALGEAEQPGTGSPTTPPPPTVPPPTATDPGGLPGLVQAERAAAAAHVAATSSASAVLAAVLAQLAASEASHPVALA